QPFGRVISAPKRSARTAHLALGEIGFLGRLAIGGFLGQAEFAQASDLLGLRLPLLVFFLERRLVALLVLVPERLRLAPGFEVSLGISHRCSPAAVPTLRRPRLGRSAHAVRLVAFALEAFAQGLAIPADGFALLARPALRGLLVGPPALHL